MAVAVTILAEQQLTKKVILHLNKIKTILNLNHIIVLIHNCQILFEY